MFLGWISLAQKHWCRFSDASATCKELTRSRPCKSWKFLRKNRRNLGHFLQRVQRERCPQQRGRTQPLSLAPRPDLSSVFPGWDTFGEGWCWAPWCLLLIWDSWVFLLQNWMVKQKNILVGPEMYPIWGCYGPFENGRFFSVQYCVIHDWPTLATPFIVYS